jgi:hypothetical protein
MRNFTLLRGPCNFLILRISPWEVLFLFLLCFSPLSVLLLPGISLSGLHPYLHPGRPSLSSTRLGWCGRRRRRGCASAARAGAEAGDAREPCGSGRRWQRWRAARRGRERLRQLGAGARGRLASQARRELVGRAEAGGTGAGAEATAWRGSGAQARGGAAARGWRRPGVPFPVSSCAGERLRFPSPWAQHRRRSGLMVLERTGARVRRCCSMAVRGRPAQGVVEPRVVDVGGRRGEGSGRGQAALRAARGERRWPGATSSEEPRCNQAQRAPITHTEVEVGATRHGFNAQRKAGGGGRPALTVSQQVERAAELQDPEVRAELDWRVRGCKRECSTGGRLGSISARECACKATGHARVG